MIEARSAGFKHYYVGLSVVRNDSPATAFFIFPFRSTKTRFIAARLVTVFAIR